MNAYQSCHEAAEFLRARLPLSPTAGVVLGSGLASFATSLSERVEVPFSEIPHFPRTSVVGHPGCAVFGRIAGVPIAALQGRVHLYEGASAAEVAFPVRVLAALGVRTLVVTNAAGGIRADLTPGDLMMIVDHINLSGHNPLTGMNDERFGPRFPDMSTAYDPGLRTLLEMTAHDLSIPLKRGVYACMSGPSYETPAEIRMLRALGADATGMSTVCETVAAVHMGLKVAGISCISNHAAGMGPSPLSHAEVTATTARVGERFSALLAAFFARI